MGMVQEVITSIIESERRVEEQMVGLVRYSQELDDLSAHIQEVINGSTQGAEQQMLDQVAQTKKKVDEAVQSLSLTKQLLIQTRAI